jgi:hypothetical protein
VSETYPRSKALIPAWLGRRGCIEFPAHRVVAGEAAIAHELVHVLFPNGNRVLAEGLAIYLQQKLCPHIPVYPNFGDRLETVVADFLRTTFRHDAHHALWSMELDAFERISTPDRLTLRITRDTVIGAKPGIPDPPPAEIKTMYAVAGSLVELLLENFIGDRKELRCALQDHAVATPGTGLGRARALAAVLPGRRHILLIHGHRPHLENLHALCPVRPARG